MVKLPDLPDVILYQSLSEEDASRPLKGLFSGTESAVDEESLLSVS